MRSQFENLIGAPIIELVCWAYRAMRGSVYADVEGRYFEYKGNPIDIVEGIGSERWLSLPNVRKTLTELPRYATLNRLYPKATRLDGKLSAEFIESLALVDFLKKSQDQRSIRFLRWLQREVIFPAEKREASHGL